MGARIIIHASEGHPCPPIPIKPASLIYGLWLTKWNWKWFGEWKVDALDLEIEGMLLYELLEMLGKVAPI